MSKSGESQRRLRLEPSAVQRAVESIREMIRQHQAEGKDRLPPEKDLSEQLAMGRSTLREALALLEAEGLILRRRRVGTLILPGTRPWGPTGLAYPVHMILALPEFLEESGSNYEMREATLRRVEPSQDAADALGTPSDGEVLMMSRLYAIDSQPAVLLEQLMPPVIGDQEVRIHSLQQGLATFLQEAMDISLAKVESRITAEAASGKLAEQLDVPEGAPLLVMYARLIAKRAGVVALGKLVFRPGLMAISVQAVEEFGHSLGVASGSDLRDLHSISGPWTARDGSPSTNASG